MKQKPEQLDKPIEWTLSPQGDMREQSLYCSRGHRHIHWLDKANCELYNDAREPS